MKKVVVLILLNITGISLIGQTGGPCGKPFSMYDLQVNNVRARINHGGSLFSDAAYIFPNPSRNQLAVSSVFSANMWLGGLDEDGIPVVSAGSYRALGYDYFTGPVISGIVDSLEFCNSWDRFFTVKGENIYRHQHLAALALNAGLAINCDLVPEDVLYWPGKGNPHFSKKFGWSLPDISLAGFWDENDDGIYNACDGDFPRVPDDSCGENNDENKVVPTEIVFYVYNDVMGKQELTGPNRINMETQVHAYAFTTDDELNDMTFYHYKFINKSNQRIRDFYSGFWIDADLGCYSDDYIGSIPSRNMGYIYNSDAVDGAQGEDCFGTSTYGNKIPFLAIKLLVPPMAAKVFARDMDGNIILVNGEKVLLDPPVGTGLQDTLVRGKMSSFNYFENCSVGSPDPETCDPERGKELQFHEALLGRDHLNPITNEVTKYAFPDEPNDPSGWSMCSTIYPYGDRRILMSAGPLHLSPGQHSTQTIGLFNTFEVRHPCPDLSRVKMIDDKLQNLFDNCLQNMLTGPDAPEMTATSDDRKLLINLFNTSQSNNVDWLYTEKIKDIANDEFYRFEGVKVYQLLDRNVKPIELENTEFARLVYLSDTQNGVSEVYNWEFVVNPDTNDIMHPFVWKKLLKADGNDTGFDPEFLFDEDRFATVNKTLVNGREYHFMAVAYGYNNYENFDTINGNGQARAYIEGKRNIKLYSFSPRYNLTSEEDQIQVIRLSGEGNPHQFLLMEEDMDEKILAPGFDGRVVYKTGYGPLTGRITDPSKWDENNLFELFIDGTFSLNREICSYGGDAFWTLKDVHNNEILLENVPLNVVVEYLLDAHGFALTVHNYPSAGKNYLSNYGAVGSNLEYKDESGPKWFESVRKSDLNNLSNQNKWLNPFAASLPSGFDIIAVEPFINMNDNPFFTLIAANFETQESFEDFYLSPAAYEFQATVMSPVNRGLRLRDLNNVDIIFTSDKSKWSKCMVVESANPYYYAKAGLSTIGDVQNFELRNSPSIGKNGEPLSDGTVGFSYFPGYAVDVETGERLNIFFGENSVYSGENSNILIGGQGIGGDLLFNPSSQLISDLVAESDVRRYVAGGQHYIYVTRQKYDGCNTLATKVRKGVSIIQKLKAAAAITWCAFPIVTKDISLLPVAQGLIPNDVRVQLRVDQSYSKSRRYNIERERDCETNDDRPVYWFTFKKPEPSSVSEKVFAEVKIIPNPGSTNENRFIITNLTDQPVVSLYDITGKMVATGNNIQTNILQFSGENTFHLECKFEGKLTPGLYLIRLTDLSGAESFTSKWVVY